MRNSCSTLSNKNALQTASVLLSQVAKDLNLSSLLNVQGREILPCHALLARCIESETCKQVLSRHGWGRLKDAECPAGRGPLLIDTSEHIQRVAETDSKRQGGYKHHQFSTFHEVS